MRFRISKPVFIFMLACLGLRADASILDGDPIDPKAKYTETELNNLSTDLFLLALGSKGYAGGKSGVCVDYNEATQPPTFYIAANSENAFTTGMSDDINFDVKKLANVLSFFHQFQKNKLKEKLRPEEQIKLDVDVMTYADPQHVQKVKFAPGHRLTDNEFAWSLSENRRLTSERANTIVSKIRTDEKLDSILNLKADPRISETLESKFRLSNESYQRGLENLLKCDVRRKVVLKTTINMDDVKGPPGVLGYAPKHEIASPKIRGEVQGAINSKIKYVLNSPGIVNIASPELRAVAATEKLLSMDSGILDQCKTEPFRSLLTQHIWGLTTHLKPPRKSQSQPVIGKPEAEYDYSDYITLAADQSDFLKADVYTILGGANAVGFRDGGDEDGTHNSWYDYYRTTVLLNEGIRSVLRDELKREPTSKEVSARIQWVANNLEPDPAKLSLKKRDREDPELVKQAVLEQRTKNLRTYLGQLSQLPGMTQKLSASAPVTGSGSMPTSSKEVWSIGKGTGAYQCFDVSSALASTLAQSKNTSYFKSGSQLVDEHKGSKVISIGFDPAKLEKVPPASGSFQFRPDVRDGKGIGGIVCEHCGMGIEFPENGDDYNAYDRSLNTSVARKSLKEFSKSVDQGGRWGALMVPMTYVIPGCKTSSGDNDCGCNDYFDKIKKCTDVKKIADGVESCSNGVIRINPLKGHATDAANPEKVDTRVSVDIPAEKLKGACIFSPPVFHTCAVSPDGRAEEGKTEIPNDWLPFFDPYLMKYIGSEVSKINKNQSRDAILGQIKNTWCSECLRDVGVAGKTPREIIEDVKCNSGAKIGMPTGDDAKDCPHLKK